MVKQKAKDLGLEFHARVQLDLFDDLFKRRNSGEKVALGKAFENQFLEGAATPQEKHIAGLIKIWRETQVSQLSKDLVVQHARLVTAKEQLKIKTTKKAENEVRVSTNKIAQLESRIARAKTSEYLADDEKSVFPFGYVSMVYTNDAGERLVAPFRYHLRPAGQNEDFDRKYNGCYNARRDNLGNAFWQPLFGKRHGVLVIDRFYEHVSAADYRKKFAVPNDQADKENLILCFQPEGFSRMIVPTIWDINTGKGRPDLYSCAIITDDPPNEIAETGHNRCPIFLKEENVEKWLSPKGRSLSELYDILLDKQTPRYRHSLFTAA